MGHVFNFAEFWVNSAKKPRCHYDQNTSRWVSNRAYSKREYSSLYEMAVQLNCNTILLKVKTIGDKYMYFYIEPSSVRNLRFNVDSVSMDLISNGEMIKDVVFKSQDIDGLYWIQPT